MKERSKELSETLSYIIGQTKPISEVATTAYLLDFYNMVTKSSGGSLSDFQGEKLKAYTKSYFEEYEKLGITKRGREKKWK